MKQVGKALFVGLLSAMILSQAATVMADQNRRDHRGRHEDRDHRGDHDKRHGKRYGKHHDKRHGKYKWCDYNAKVRIRDLRVDPKYFYQGKPLHKWYVDAWLKSDNYCEANVSIWDGHDVVARERYYKLQPGRNRIELEPEHRYRFRKQKHCFDVYFNLKGNRRKIDADRTFCAYEKRVWTLDEGRRHDRRSHRR